MFQAVTPVQKDEEPGDKGLEDKQLHLPHRAAGAGAILLQDMVIYRAPSPHTALEM